MIYLIKSGVDYCTDMDVIYGYATDKAKADQIVKKLKKEAKLATSYGRYFVEEVDELTVDLVEALIQRKKG